MQFRDSVFNTIHMYSGITSGRVLDGELLYTKILTFRILVRFSIYICISLLLPRLAKLPSQCCSNGLGNFCNLGRNEEILLKIVICFTRDFFPPKLLSLRKKATIHQVTTMLAKSENSYFQVITTCSC